MNVTEMSVTDAMSAKEANTLLTELVRASEKSHVAWEETAFDDSYRCNFQEYVVRIGSSRSEDSSTYYVKVMNLLAEVVHQSREPEDLLERIYESALARLGVELVDTAPDHSEEETRAVTRPGLESPFIVGWPVDNDAHLFGREALRKLLRETVERGQPAQILSERRMGKTSLLRWVERHASTWQDRPVVLLDTQGIHGRSPATFVRALASALRKTTSGRPEEALKELLPVVVLVDEADGLAEPGHGFDDGFLEVLRSFGQTGDLVWISASYYDLRSLFESTGLTSSFLNDSRVLEVGQLEDEAARDIAAQAGENAVSVALDIAGGWAYGVQWVGDALWRRAENVDSVGDAFADVAGPLFYRWWLARSDEERSVLRSAVGGLAVKGLTSSIRRVARRLARRGLLVERSGAFVLPGAAWRDFVAAIG